MSGIITRFSTFCCFLIACSAAVAQPAPGGGGGRGGMGAAAGMRMMVMGGGGNGAQFRQQTLDAIKTQLGVEDDEWEKLSPKFEKLMDAKRQLATGAGLSWSSQNGGAPVFRVSDQNVDTPAGKAMQEIRAALDDKDTPPEELSKKLEALKQALAQARADLEAAQKELKDSLTPRQQAIIATLGYLE